MTEIFVCKTAYQSGNRKLLSCSLNHVETWGFVPCGFTTESYDEARDHVNADKGGNLACWIESHEHGNLNLPVLREMHGSDFGGVYVNDFREPVRV